MTAFTQEALCMLHNSLPSDYPKFKALNEMFTLHLIDNLLTQDELVNHPYFNDYFEYYKRNIYTPPALAIPKNQQDIQRVHNEHHLSDIFHQLKTKQDITRKLEHCPIKLASASGMTESYEKMDILSVHAFLEDICSGTKIDARLFMKRVVKSLQESGLYDHDCSYRVALFLSSDRTMKVVISHDSRKSTDGENVGGYHFKLTDSFKTILHILENHGHRSDSDTIKSSIGPIIEAQPEEDDDNSEFA